MPRACIGSTRWPWASTVADTSRWGWLGQVVQLALPVAVAMGSQTVVNLFDAALVGPLGADALAAVGQGGYAALVCTAPLMGLTYAVQARTAEASGAKGMVEAPTNGGLAVVLALGLPVTALLVWAAPWLLGGLAGDAAVAELGGPYLQLRWLGLPAVGIAAVLQGTWSGLGRPSVFLATQLVTHALNIVLSYLLIHGHLGLPAWGVFGAGVGTLVSLWVGAAVALGLALALGREHGLLRSRRMPGVDSLVRLALPAAVEQGWVFVSISALLAIIATLGTAEVAAASVLVHLVGLLMVPAVALGVAANTLVAHARGRQAAAEARAWGWRIGGVGAGLLWVCGLPLVLVPDTVLGAFLHASPQARAVGIVPLQLVGLAAAADGFGTVWMHALIGAGASRVVMVWSVGLQTVVLVLCWLLGPVLGFGFTVVWSVHVANRFVLAAAMGRAWERATRLPI